MTLWQLLREARRTNAEVYHFHDPELIPIALLLRCRGKKVIYDIHEDLPRDILSKHYLPNWTRKPLSKVADWCEKSASRFFSALVPATPTIFEAFRHINTKMVMVQNFPIVDEFLPAYTPWVQRKTAVAYVGNISRIRGIAQLVKAMALIPDAIPLTLELAGDYSPPAFRNELVTLRGWNRVRELGVLDRQGVAKVLGNVRAGLVLFQDVPSHRDAYPTKMFEYMSAGIPIIASSFPAWREIVDRARCGLLIDPSSLEAVAEAILFILNNPTQAEEMGRRGRELVVRELNWQREEKKLLALYRELLTPTDQC
jgi:glycosyltransferase involved in cell wall biosynthesis